MHVLAVGGEGYRVTAQMVLVCCWRTMKEVAMLLGQLCQSLPLHYTNDNVCTHTGLITEQQVRPQIPMHTPLASYYCIYLIHNRG